MGRSLSGASGVRLMARITRYGFSRQAGRIVRPDQLIRRKPVPAMSPASETVIVAGPIGGSMAQASRRPPELLPLPKVGEMEKRFDPQLRGER
jgi:hypothetical protein